MNEPVNIGHHCKARDFRGELQHTSDIDAADKVDAILQEAGVKEDD